MKNDYLFLVPKLRAQTRRTKSKPVMFNTSSLSTSQADFQLPLTWIFIALISLFLISMINSHYHIMHVFNYILYPFSLIPPLIMKISMMIPMIIQNMFIFFWKLISYIIRYEWICLSILISKILQNSNYFPSWKRKVQSIEMEIAVWYQHDPFRKGSIIVGILLGPFLFKILFYCFLFIVKLVILWLWSLFVIILRYEWLFLLILISDIVSQSCNLPHFKSIKESLNGWCRNNSFPIGIVIISIAVAPFLLEKSLSYSIPWIIFLMICLWKVILFIIRYEWLIILMFISTVLVKSGDFPNFTNEYQALQNRIKIWHRDDEHRIFVLTVFIITGPFLFDQFLSYSLPILSLVVLCLLGLAIVIIPSIVINDICTNISHSQNYILRCKRIANSLRDSWEKHSRSLIRKITFCLLVRGPFFIEFLLSNVLTIVKLIFIHLFAFVLFMTRYGWLASSIIIIEQLIKSNYFTDFNQLYNSLKEKLNNWQKNDPFRRRFLICLILGIPFLFEFFLFPLLWVICTLIIQCIFTIVIDF